MRVRLLPRSELLRHEQDDLFIPFTLRGLAAHCAVTGADRRWHRQQNRTTVKQMKRVEKEFDNRRTANPHLRSDSRTFGLEKAARMDVAVAHMDAVLDRYEGRHDAPLGLAALRHSRDLLAEARAWAGISADISPMTDELRGQRAEFASQAENRDAHPAYAALTGQADALLVGISHAYRAASLYQDAARAAYTDALSAGTRTELDDRASRLERQAATEALTWTTTAKTAIAEWRRSVGRTSPPALSRTAPPPRPAGLDAATQLAAAARTGLAGTHEHRPQAGTSPTAARHTALSLPGRSAGHTSDVVRDPAAGKRLALG